MTRRLSLTIATFSCLVIFSFCFILSGCSENKITESDNLKPNVSINYVYYEINGTTDGDLRHQMDQFGPSDKKRLQHDAYTEWYVDWYYPNSETNDSCGTGPITVTVTITHTFPKWNIPSDAPQDMVEKWSNYLKALQTHEVGHRQIGIDAGHEILQALNELSVYPTCAKLEQIADMTGQNILDEFRQKEVSYDQTTRHGASQGARFP